MRRIIINTLNKPGHPPVHLIHAIGSARLCLDCDEVHDAQQCPHCASETFAFITRWVPVPDPDRPDRPDEADLLIRLIGLIGPSTTASKVAGSAEPEALGAYREMLDPEQKSGGKWRTIRRGAVGLALFGIAGWIWRHNNRPGDEASETTGDETIQSTADLSAMVASP